MKQVVLLAAFSYKLFCDSSAVEYSSEECVCFHSGTKEVELVVDFESNFKGSFMQDVIIDCGHFPYILQSLSVDVATRPTLRVMQKLRKSFQKPDEYWEIDENCVKRFGLLSEEDGYSLSHSYSPIPSLEDLTTAVNELDVLEVEKMPRKENDYRKRFHTLLYLEERHRQQKSAIVSAKGAQFRKETDGSFTVKIAVGVAVSSASSLTAYLRLSDFPEVYEVLVEEIRDDFVRLNWAGNRDLMKKLSDMSSQQELNGDFQLRFDRSHYLNLHSAIDRLPTNVLQSHANPDFRSVSLKDASAISRAIKDLSDMDPKIWNNERQRYAIGLVFCKTAGSSVHRIINGPFGSGKTFLLAEAVRLLVKKNKRAKVLICTQSNPAADLYVRHLMNERTINRLMRICYTYRDRRSVDRDVLPHFLQGEDGFFRMPSESELQGPTPLVVVTTLMTSAKLVLLPGNFTHIIVDEAAQATEPETIAPLALAGKNTVLVLAGDTYQVR